MANYENTRYDFDGAYLTGVQGVNTGLILPWSDSSIPSGFLECNGSAVSRTTYSGLFAVVGTNYGIGDGSTTFNIPDLADRVCQHKSPTKAQFSTGGADTVAATGSLSGAAIGNTTLSTPQLPSHSHPGTNMAQAGIGGNGTGSAAGASASTGGGGAHSHPLASSSFVGDATSVLQPYLTLVYIIKT